MKKEDAKRESKLTSECTTIIVGEEQTSDGSRMMGRSSDFTSMTSINFEMHEDTDCGPEEFVAKDSAFRCPLPRRALGYTAMPDTEFPGEWGSCGYNTAGVGMSSTETIFSSDKALAKDPYVDDGLGENCTFNIVLPYIHTAREGVARLGSLIEYYGSAEGFGIGFIDENETWYLENCCGHLWLACRISKDKYFVTGNQSRFRDYDPNDKNNFMAAPGLMEFAKENGLWDGQGKFDFHEVYQRDEKLDTTYNYPRVWGLQKLFSPDMVQDVTKNTFPVFAEAKCKITLQDMRTAFRFHYDNTEHDPYLHSNGREPYRPVSIFRTQQTHIMQYRPWLPKAIGCISYVAIGMADLGVFLPLYQGVKSYPKPYMVGSVGRADNKSAYWKFRKVMTLGMMNYNEFAPIIKAAYTKLETENDKLQVEMETEYLKIYKEHPKEACELLQNFSDKLLKRALRVAGDLELELYSRLTSNVEKEYLFHGA